MPESYKPDILGNGFEQLTFAMPDDYEGKVVCTLVRKQNAASSKKAVLYVHGFLDYFFQEEMADKLVEQGYNFYAVDLRKCGRSILPHQKPYNLRNVDEYFADLETAITQIKHEGNTTLVLLAHSTGGLTCSLYLNHRNNVSALVLNSPFLEMNKRWLTRKVAIPFVAPFAVLFPNMAIKSGFSPYYGQSIHKDHKGEWSYRLDWKPIAAEKVTLSWLRGIYKAHKCIKRGLAIKCPILVLSSDKSMKGRKWSDAFHTADLVLNVNDIQTLADRLGENVTKVQIPNGKHDLMLSGAPVRASVYHTLFSWLNSHLA